MVHYQWEIRLVDDVSVLVWYALTDPAVFVSDEYARAGKATETPAAHNLPGCTVHEI